MKVGFTFSVLLIPGSLIPEFCFLVEMELAFISKVTRLPLLDC